MATFPPRPAFSMALAAAGTPVVTVLAKPARSGLACRTDSLMLRAFS